MGYFGKYCPDSCKPYNDCDPTPEGPAYPDCDYKKVMSYDNNKYRGRYNNDRKNESNDNNGGYKKQYTDEEIKRIWQDTLLKDWWEIVGVDENAQTSAGEPAVKIKCKSLAKTWHTVCVMPMKYDFVKKKYEKLKDTVGGFLVGAKVWIILKNEKFSTIQKVKAPDGKEVFI